MTYPQLEDCADQPGEGESAEQEHDRNNGRTNTMSNYPPGVSGNEWQIAGGQLITLGIDGNCPDCDFDGAVEAEVIDGTAYWTCDCGTDGKTELIDYRP